MDSLTKTIRSAKDFEYAVQLTRILLVPFGLWPTRLSLTYQCLRPILILLSISIILFMFIPLCLFMFLIVKDLGIRLKLIGPLSFSMMSLFKYIVVIAKKRQISECIQGMSEDWQMVEKIEDRKGMLENAKTGRLITMICVMLMYGGGMPYVTILPIARGERIIGNVSIRHLAYPSYFVFFNPHIRPIYDAIFSIQILCGFVRYTVTCGVYSIVIICVMHICSQINITISMLGELVDNFDSKLLGKVVRQHLKFLKFAEKLEDIFKEICLVEVLGSTCIICFLGYYLITEYEQRENVATVTYLFLLMSFVFNIFILCYIGQVLTEKCESIGTAAYMIDWYRLSGKDARNMILLVSWKHRPVALTAGKMMKLSIRSFTSIIKAAASYLNILWTAIANSK